MTPKIAVIYYSATGTIDALAHALAEGAESKGAETRVRRVAELAPPAAIDANPAWRAYADRVAGEPEASHDDLLWADAYALGSPTRFGQVTSQLKQFIDSTGGLWAQGKITGRPATSFTSSINAHGGQESTILAMNNVLYHWGSIIVPPGYLDQRVYGGGGNPYGTSFATGTDGDAPDDGVLEAARFQGERLAEVTARLLG